MVTRDNGGSLMTVRQAQERLGVSKYKMTRLLRERGIAKADNPADRRTGLVARAAIEALARELAGIPKGKAPAGRRKRTVVPVDEQAARA